MGEAVTRGRDELQRLARRIAAGDLTSAAKAFAILASRDQERDPERLQDLADTPEILAGKGSVCRSDNGAFVVIVDASEEEGLVRLPSPGSVMVGSIVYLKKVDASGNRVSATGLGEPLPNDEEAMAHVGIQYESISLVNDGKRWWLV